MSQSGALRGYAVAAHPPEHAGTDAPGNLATIHRGPPGSNPGRRAGHCLAHDLHCRFSRRDRGVFSDLAGVHSSDALRAVGRVRLFAAGRHARGQNGGPALWRAQATAPATGHGGTTQDRPADFSRARRNRGRGAGRTRGGGEGFGIGPGPFLGARPDSLRVRFSLRRRGRAGALLGGAQPGRRAGH